MQQVGCMMSRIVSSVVAGFAWAAGCGDGVGSGASPGLVLALEQAREGGLHLEAHAVGCRDGARLDHERPAWVRTLLAEELGRGPHQVLARVDAGCYDVVAIPLAADGAPACAPVAVPGVRVTSRHGAAVRLVGLCAEPAALPEEVARNHPPRIESFGLEGDGCGARLCATAEDADGDRLELTFEAGAGVALAPLGAVELDGNRASACAAVRATGRGAREVRLVAYDLVEAGTRFEARVPARSRDTATVRVESCIETDSTEAGEHQGVSGGGGPRLGSLRRAVLEEGGGRARGAVGGSVGEVARRAGSKRGSAGERAERSGGRRAGDGGTLQGRSAGEA